MKPFRLLHLPKTGGTSLRVSGIYGDHWIGYDKTKTNLLIIRDPIDRTLSHFKEQGKDKLVDWFNETYHNYQVKYLKQIFQVDSLNEIKEFILKNKIIVIPTDELTKRMKELGVNIPHTNKSRRDYLPTKEEIELIKANTKLDRKLYDWVKSIP